MSKSTESKRYQLTFVQTIQYDLERIVKHVEFCYPNSSYEFKMIDFYTVQVRQPISEGRFYQGEFDKEGFLTENLYKIYTETEHTTYGLL